MIKLISSGPNGNAPEPWNEAIQIIFKKELNNNITSFFVLNSVTCARD